MRHCCGGGDDDPHDHDHEHSPAPHRGEARLGTHYLLALNDAGATIAQQLIPAGAVIEEALALAFGHAEYAQLHDAPVAARCVPYITERGDKFWVVPVGGAALCAQAAQPVATLSFYEAPVGICYRLQALTDIAADALVTVAP